MQPLKYLRAANVARDWICDKCAQDGRHDVARYGQSSVRSKHGMEQVEIMHEDVHDTSWSAAKVFAVTGKC